MRYVSFTHVDVITGIPVTVEPARNGPAYPKGVRFGFALESRYPTTAPTFFGQTGGRTDLPGILGVLTKAEYDAAQAAETAARLGLARDQALATLADIRWQAEEAGTALPDGTRILTDRATQAKLTAAYVKAKADPAYVIPAWKLATGVFAPLDAAAIILIGNRMEAHVQACFSREAVVSAAIVAAQTVEAIAAIDMRSGWPA